MRPAFLWIKPASTLMLALSLGACASSLTMPAAVKLNNGSAMVGTTTAATSGGIFEVRDEASGLSCAGSYDPFDRSPTLSAPFRCSDGRVGTVTVTRSADGMAGSGDFRMTDGTAGKVAFGRNAASVLEQSTTTPQPPVPQPASRQTAGVDIDKPLKAWTDCAVAQGRTLYTAQGTASEIAIAALEACYRQEATYRQVLERAGATNSAETTERVRKVINDRLILIVLKARTPKEQPAPPPSKPSPKLEERDA